MRPARRPAPARERPRLTAKRVRLSILIAATLAGSIATGVTVRSAQEQIRRLSTAKTDVVEFSLAQFDVEFLRMRLALQTALSVPEPDLDHVRLTFDIFYSRAGTLAQGQLYAPLRAAPEIQADYEDVTAFLDRNVALIDASDAVLADNIALLAERSEDVAEAVRGIAVAGLQVLSSRSDVQRREAHDVLVRLAVVLPCLFGGLLVQVLWLLRELLHTRRHSAARIAEAGRRQQALVGTSIDGIVLADRQGRIIETNAAAAEMFGQAGADLSGTEMFDLIFQEAEARKAAAAAFRFIAEGRRPDPSERRFELVASVRSGRSFPVEVSVDRAEMGTCGLYVIFFRDISARRAAEAALTAARDRAEAGERAKARFLAVMSHEMRTPLNGLLGSIQLLQDLKMAPEQSDCIETIRSSGTHLLGLVNDVLDVSKLESGTETARRGPVDPAALVEDALVPLRPLARQNGTDLSWRWAGPARETLGLDAHRLRRVLVNLVGNAIKFTANGTIVVELKMTATQDLDIRVTDTGIGMPPDQLGRIFEDFETLDSTYSRKVEGTGLGLGICRRLMSIMEGEIGVESRPGAGSTFTLRFPAATLRLDPEITAPPASAASQAHRPLSILVIDDNAVNRFILCGMLKKMGHEVTEASGGRSGIAAVAEHPFDIVMMDISMPDMDGMEATRRIRAGARPGRDLPVVAVTAHALPAELAQFEAAGMDAYVAKPVERADLAATVARLAAGRPRACA